MNLLEWLAHLNSCLLLMLQLMGEAEKLQQPGNFISALVTDKPFVACVEQSGQLQAYHNVG